MITILTTPPPHWEQLSKTFGVKWEGNLVCTFGENIHCPTGKIPPDVLVHELVHVEQMRGKDPKECIDRYMTDKSYRRECEVAAYKVQASFLEQTITNPEKLFCLKHKIAKSMVTNYGGIFTIDEASAILNQQL